MVPSSYASFWLHWGGLPEEESPSVPVAGKERPGTNKGLQGNDHGEAIASDGFDQN